MKTFFRVSVLGLLMFAVVAVSNQTAVAQSDPKTELYEKFTNNYDGDLAQQKIAVAAGKEFISKYANSADDKAIIDYLRDAIPTIEQAIKDEEKRLADEKAARKLAAERAKRFAAFDGAFKKKDWNTFYSAGDAILRDQKDFYDVAIVLASVGLDQAEKNVNTFNDAAVKHAMYAIGKLKSGVKPKSPTCGGSYYVYKTDDYKNCVSNALGWMNYTVGYIKYYKQKKEDEAIPYFYEATKANSSTKDAPQPFRAIGSWYVKKAALLIEQRNSMLEERNAETKLEEPDDEKILMLDGKIDRIIGLERGYADRAIDAYSRAYSFVAVADRGNDYAKGMFSTLQNLYKLRYHEKPEMQTDTHINMQVSTIKTKQMPDPRSDVQPVMDPKTDTKPAATEPNAPKTTTGASRSRTVSN